MDNSSKVAYPVDNGSKVAYCKYTISEMILTQSQNRLAYTQKRPFNNRKRPADPMVTAVKRHAVNIQYEKRDTDSD